MRKQKIPRQPDIFLFFLLYLSTPLSFFTPEFHKLCLPFLLPFSSPYLP